MGLGRKKDIRLGDFVKALKPKRQRTMMLAKNSAAAPQGFEHTIAERMVPQLFADIADGQSLKSARQSLKGERAAMKKFGRNKKIYTGE